MKSIPPHPAIRPRRSALATTAAVAALALAGVGRASSAADADAGAAVDFESDVVPILRAKCLGCHTAKNDESDEKPKGGLALDSPAGILAGNVVEAGKPGESALYYRIVLPAEDDEVMPPAKEEKPVTEAEAATIKAWIAAGAHFGSGGAASLGPVKVLTLKEVQTMGVPDPSADALRALGEMGATITPLTVATPELLTVEFISTYDAIGDSEVKQLMAIAPNIVELDLSRTAITDEALKYVGAFARLTKLNLNNTAITDKGIAHLTGLRLLDALNLYGTKITDDALPDIAKLSKLKSIYFWKTNVTPEGMDKLRQVLDDAKIVDGVWSKESRFKIDDL